MLSRKPPPRPDVLGALAWACGAAPLVAWVCYATVLAPQFGDQVAIPVVCGVVLGSFALLMQIIRLADRGSRTRPGYGAVRLAAILVLVLVAVPSIAVCMFGLFMMLTGANHC